MISSVIYPKHKFQGYDVLNEKLKDWLRAMNTNIWWLDKIPHSEYNKSKTVVVGIGIESKSFPLSLFQYFL